MSLINVINRPACEAMGNEVYIGPTAVDFSMLKDTARVPTTEKELIKEWRESDLAKFYFDQGQSRWRLK